MSKKITQLKWQVKMGADEAIAGEPQNRFAPPAISKPAVAAPVTAKQAPDKAAQPLISNPGSAAQNTRVIAGACNNLAQLKSAVLGFSDLSIAKTATNTVFADGCADAKIMLIGEAPGAEEDEQGIPFCGASGKMLDQMLACIGLDRQKNFYITNTIFWRPPGNRRPTPEELAICLPFVQKHIALIKPELIVLVGGTAIASLLDSKEGITRMRGQFFDYGNEYLAGTIKTTAIFHPSYLLRSPGQKRVAWKDLLTLKDYIDKSGIKI